MSISLDSPHTLHISVYEKGMLGYIYIPGINENAYFDKDGFVGGDILRHGAGCAMYRRHKL
mgnify:CR=1 FL=1